VGTITKVDEFTSVIAFKAIIVLPAPVGKIIHPLLLCIFHFSSASI